MFYFIKVLVSAILIVIISEVSKRSSLLGAVFASIPIISVLAMIWLYNDTKNVQVVAALARDIFWLVLPSLALFLTLPVFLKYKFNFYLSLSLASAITICCYLLMLFLLRSIVIE